ncbi:rod shape-determining protein MreC [Patescibacteria group bacterium]|nr:rod shape-determining protein MreC [Patescibacteria group bacterium]
MNPINDIAVFLLRPIQTKIFPASQSLSNYIAKHESIEQLEKNNQELESRLSELLVENSQLKSTIKDLNIIRSEREFLEKENYNFVQARIIGKSSENKLRELIINIGSNDSIEEGFAVVSEQGYLVGKVVEVQKYISKILLITDSNSEVAAIVQNDTNAPGIVEGNLGLSLTMRLIPQNEIIQTDQSIVTSGLEANIPNGLLIGTISNIQFNPGNIFQEANVTSRVSFDNIGIVSVIVPKTVVND